MDLRNPERASSYFFFLAESRATSRSSILWSLLCASWQSTHDPLTAGTCWRIAAGSSWQAEQIFCLGIERLTVIMSPCVAAT